MAHSLTRGVSRLALAAVLGFCALPAFAAGPDAPAIDGRHLEGEMYECDPQLCGWVGGPKYTNARLDKSADRTA